jgi:threonine dehydrogenase-like Zn-dependent dehydrogenase
VNNAKEGDFVVGSFVISDNTCEICKAGFQSKCVYAEFVAQIGTQADTARSPHADGTLVATPSQPDPELIPSLLAASDVLGAGWFAAVAAQTGLGKRLLSSVMGRSASWRS